MKYAVIVAGLFAGGFLLGRWYGSRGPGFARDATCTLAELPHASVIVCEPPPNMVVEEDPRR